jgi:hypothetical protein
VLPVARMEVLSRVVPDWWDQPLQKPFYGVDSRTLVEYGQIQRRAGSFTANLVTVHTSTVGRQVEEGLTYRTTADQEI